MWNKGAIVLALSLSAFSSVEGGKKPDPGVAPPAVASGQSPPARSLARETGRSAIPMLTKALANKLLGKR